MAWGDDNAEVCTSLEVQWYGMAFRTCEDPSEPARIYLAEDSLRQMYEWLDEYAMFSLDDESAPRTFHFHGAGPQAPDPAAVYPDREAAIEMRDWFGGFTQ